YAVERSINMSALALAWVMSHPLVTAPIVGPRGPEQLEPARQALDIQLSTVERDVISAFFVELKR
ncbi:MAG: aldo/keto reductase, partial [Chloroflexi bacterium]|nr:aldo/keto reductase [Chloroflexota bacterium]